MIARLRDWFGALLHLLDLEDMMLVLVSENEMLKGDFEDDSLDLRHQLADLRTEVQWLRQELVEMRKKPAKRRAK